MHTGQFFSSFFLFKRNLLHKQRYYIQIIHFFLGKINIHGNLPNNATNQISKIYALWNIFVLLFPLLVWYKVIYGQNCLWGQIWTTLTEVYCRVLYFKYQVVSEKGSISNLSQCKNKAQKQPDLNNTFLGLFLLSHGK